MENNQRNSRKRLNSLILLVAFTAVMLIVSTYAWFSTQKNVTLSGLKGEVNVAEGLQISLDAEHWVNTINFDHFDQTDPTEWTVLETSPSTYLNTDMSFQTPVSGVTNVVPTELLPVSTTGYEGTGDGIGGTAVKFYRGTSTETVKLMADTNVLAEDNEAGFFAFDLFVMNTSAEDVTTDIIQLDAVSDVIGNQEASGVQNTARVAFALYNNNNTDAKDMTISGTNQVTAADIVAASSGSATIADIAIWEPNADKHAAAIVSSLANSIKLDDAERQKWTGLPAADAAGVSKFTATQLLPTFALTSDSVLDPVGDENTVHIADVYDWRSTGATGVAKQYTLQTTAYEQNSDGTTTQRTAPVPLVSTKKLEDNPAATDTTFTILANKYQRIRVYFWMEGQDPDCINSASLGGGLTLNLGFSKPGSDNSAE